MLNRIVGKGVTELDEEAAIIADRSDTAKSHCLSTVAINSYVTACVKATVDDRGESVSFVLLEEAARMLMHWLLSTLGLHSRSSAAI